MTGQLTLVEVEIDGAGGVDGLAGAHAVVVSPDNAHVYVASRSESAVAAFSRDTMSGAITFLEAEFDNLSGVDGIQQAEAIAISSDGKHVYVAGEGEDAVAVFERDVMGMGFGELSFVEAEFDGVGGVDGLELAGAVALDASGDNVYVAATRGSLGGIAGDDWLAVFTRSSATGALSFLESFDEVTFGTATTGIFALCTGVGNENSGVVVSPDETRVYLSNPFFGTIATFSRSVVDGSLTFLDSNCDLSFGLDGIAGAINIAMSHDGKRAYSASSAFESVAVLCTNTGAGTDVDLTDTGPVGSDVVEIGCGSITAGGGGVGYDIVSGTKVIFQTPSAVLTSGFSVSDGEFTVTAGSL